MRGKRKPSVNAGESEMAGEGRRDWQLGEIKTDKQEGGKAKRGGGWGNSKTEIGSGEEGEAAG